MAHEVRVPRLGWSMEEGTFVGWTKQDGERVEIGQTLFELEGEKALEEIAAIDAGILRIPPSAPEPGAIVAVGALLGYLCEEGETLPSLSASGPSPSGRGQGEGVLLSTPPAPLPTGDRPGEGVSPAATPYPLTSSQASTPRARRIARELGVDWTTLTGTGRDGRVREIDVRTAKTAPGSQPTFVQLSSRRKVIAERMRASHARIVPVTLHTTADATNLVNLRQQFKAAGGAIFPSYTDIVACLVATVLKQHRNMAACWSEDQSSLILPNVDGFDIGIAVDTKEGLLVPVVLDVGRLSLIEVARRSRELIERARGGRLTTREMQGGVFTVSTLGAFGVDAFTPVIHYPETAILGLGAIRREAVVLPDDRVVCRERISLSLTFDHCAHDGAPAAAFLRDLDAAIENPSPFLVGC